MEEIYTTIPYHKEKWSAKVTTSITKLKNNIRSNTGSFFSLS